MNQRLRTRLWLNQHIAPNREEQQQLEKGGQLSNPTIETTIGEGLIPSHSPRLSARFNKKARKENKTVTLCTDIAPRLAFYGRRNEGHLDGSQMTAREHQSQ
eukprot:1157979-Pelagomonas_calceolata.AAC.7